MSYITHLLCNMSTRILSSVLERKRKKQFLHPQHRRLPEGYLRIIIRNQLSQLLRLERRLCLERSKMQQNKLNYSYLKISLDGLDKLRKTIAVRLLITFCRMLSIAWRLFTLGLPTIPSMISIVNSEISMERI